jgi:hypothetical protein
MCETVFQETKDRTKNKIKYFHRKIFFTKNDIAFVYFIKRQICLFNIHSANT